MKNEIWVFFATGFEEVEALASVDVLRRAGLCTRMISVTGLPMVTGGHNVTIQTDLLIEDLDTSELPRAIVLPGGVTDLNECEPLLHLIRRQHEARQTIGAICASPRVLGAAGIGDGEMQATCYPGFEGQTRGFVMTGRDVEVSGHIVTGRGPAMAIDFAFALLRHVEGEEKAREVADGFLYAQR